MAVRFRDRADAGQQLGARLVRWRDADPVVVGLPRGGVPVAAEVARILGAPLDVVVVRKLGVPYQPELAMGAVGEDGIRVLNPEVLRLAQVTDSELVEVERAEVAEVERRARRLRGARPRLPLAGRTVLIVDDGLATGSTARAACRVARAEGAARVVLAVPVAPPGWESRLGSDADDLVCLATPRSFWAVGEFYDDFSPVSDEAVADALTSAAAVPGPAPSAGHPPAGPVRDEEVEVDLGRLRLGGRLSVPGKGRGLVIFAHGSGSSRHSPRNRFVAATLNQTGLATLLFDLLSPAEEAARANVFDIELLAQRLSGSTRWARSRPGLAGLPVAYFGASTGAAAALWSAAEPDSDIAAVVSRGGRPDLAFPRLGAVRAPTLLIVGGDDVSVLELNRRARAELRCPSRLAVVPGASHLFEEPGTLAAAAGLAAEWFLTHLTAPSDAPA